MDKTLYEINKVLDAGHNIRFLREDNKTVIHINTNKNGQQHHTKKQITKSSKLNLEIRYALFEFNDYVEKYSKELKRNECQQ